MATEKTLQLQLEKGNISWKDQLAQKLFVDNNISMTAVMINIFTMTTKKKLGSSLIPSLTKLMFGLRIPLPTAILPRNNCAKS